MIEIGPRQRFALDRLKWRVEIAPADDKVMVSLHKRGLALSVAGKSGAEWSITAAGMIALGFDLTADDEPATTIEIALAGQLNARLRVNPMEPRP